MTQLTKTLKWFAAVSLLAFGAGAYAGTDDGNVSGNNSSQQTPVHSSYQR